MTARAAVAESLAPRMSPAVEDLQVRAIAAACAGALAVGDRVLDGARREPG